MEICDTYHVLHFLSYSYLLFLVCFFFLLPCFPLFGSIWGMTPMMSSLNLLKIDPWFGLVKESPVVSSVGHHSTEISPLWILSVTKIYLMFICLVRLLLNDLTIFSRRIALFLSWYMMFSVTPQPWYYKKFLVQRTDDISWSTPKISHSVELLVLSFCLLNTDIGNPRPIVSPHPVCPLILGCTACEPSINN